MVQVKLETSEDFRTCEKRYRLRVRGHANHTETNDLVCAAVSMLTQALIAWIKENLKDVAETNPTVCEPGDVRVEITVRPVARSRMCGALGVIVEGFRLLADKYPENVSFWWSDTGLD